VTAALLSSAAITSSVARAWRAKSFAAFAEQDTAALRDFDPDYVG
jgi:hypothetical protein